MANYVDSFEAYGAASGIPSGFTSRWVTTTWSTVDDSGDIILRSNGGGRILGSMNAIDGDANRDNVEVLAQIRSASLIDGTANVGLAVRGSGSSGSETGYRAYITGNNLILAKLVSGTGTTLANPAFTASSNTWYWMRLRANSTSIQVRVWGGAIGDEPGTWNIDITDSAVSGTGWAGFHAFKASTNQDCSIMAIATNGDTATINDAVAVSATSVALVITEYNPTVTAVENVEVNATTDALVITENAAVVSSNYVDDFQSYGAASGIPSGFTSRWYAATWSTVDESGDIILRTTGGSRTLGSMNAVDGDVNRANVEVLGRIRSSYLPGGTANVGLVVRGSGASGTETGYRVYINGGNLLLARLESGAHTTITSPTFTAIADTWYWMRFRVIGTSIKVKVWSGNLSAEPGSWTIDTTDANISAAGWVGLHAHIAATNQDCSVMAVATGGGTATTAVDVFAVPQSLTITENAATVDVTANDIAVSATSVALTITENAADVVAATEVLAATAALLITENAASVGAGYFVDAASQALVITENAAISGINYIDYFEEDLAGAGLPSGWTDRWTTGTWSIIIEAGDNILQQSGTNNRHFASMDAVDDDTDAEIVGKIRASSLPVGPSIGFILRGSGAAATENGYKADLVGATLYISKYVSGAITTLAQDTAIKLPNVWYWLKFRVNGTSLKAKIWAEGSNEPVAWTLETTDSDVTSGTWHGFFSFTNSSTHDLAGVAIATGGGVTSISTKTGDAIGGGGTGEGGCYTIDTTPSVVANPGLAKPAYLNSVYHTAFNSNTTRITDNTVFSPDSNVRHYYAKTCPWNSDGTYLNVNRHLLNGSSFARIRLINNIPGEYKWAHTQPNIIYTVNGLQFAKTDINAGDAKTVLRTFTGVSVVYMGPFEGNISADDRYVALAGQNGTQARCIVYDILNDVIVADVALTTGTWSELDWLSISPSGDYVVVLWNFGTGKGVDVFNRDMTGQRKLCDFASSHGDIGYEYTSGAEAFVQFQGVAGSGFVNGYRLSDGTAFQVLPSTAGNRNTASPMHASCRNINRPGWVYISTGASGGSLPQEVFAARIDPGNTIVERFTHHNATSAVYERQPQACPNQDGTQVIFASDWNNSSGEINAYIVEAVCAAGVTVGASYYALVITENAATVQENVTVTNTTQALTITELQAAVNTSFAIAAEFATLTITENAARIDIISVIEANFAALAISPFLASVDLVSPNVIVEPFTVRLGITPYPAGVIGTVTEVEAATGGFWFAYDSEMIRQKKARKEREKAREKALKTDDEVTRQLAEELWKKEEAEAKLSDLKKILEIAAKSKYEDERINRTLNRAIMQGNFSALEALARELAAVREEERFLLEAAIILLM